jgi:hypothetical protein
MVHDTWVQSSRRLDVDWINRQSEFIKLKGCFCHFVLN